MEIIDISVRNYNGMRKYPSLENFRHEFIKDYSLGDNYSLSKMTMPMHIGTHIDAPYHFIEGGIKIDEIPLGMFYGECFVAEIDSDIITKESLVNKSIACTRILFRTQNSIIQRNGDEVLRNVYIDRSGAQYLADIGVKLVGIDYFSVDSINIKNKNAHQILLSEGIVILEGINLYGVEEGEYIISSFPLSVLDSEASPCRAVLIKL